MAIAQEAVMPSFGMAEMGKGAGESDFYVSGKHLSTLPFLSLTGITEMPTTNLQTPFKVKNKNSHQQLSCQEWEEKSVKEA